MLIFNLKKMTDLLYEEWDLAKLKSGAKGKTCAYIYLFEILSESEKIVIKKEAIFIQLLLFNNCLDIFLTLEFL